MSRRAPKRVHFKRDSVLEEVIEHPKSQKQHYHRRQDQQHKSQQERRPQPKGALSNNTPKRIDKTVTLVKVSPLFRCTSQEDIRDVLRVGKGAITDVFQGYNALHWFCNAKSTSPSIIQELLHQGIDINALSRQTQTRGPLIRHTALGYACRNANVKAVHTLLQNGADPRGIAGLIVSRGLPKEDIHGNPIVYPSPLQELLCQPTHGPRPGKCPWIYHLSEEDEEKDGYLDEGDLETAPELRPLAILRKDPICRLCAADWHIWEPWPENEAEKLSARERRRSCFRSQIVRLGNRMRACVQLLLDYSCSDPPTTFPQFDDPRLRSAIDCLLETFYRFFYPIMLCEKTNSPSERAAPAATEELSHPLSRPVFSSFGEICDMLLEHAGYEGRCETAGMRGQDRIIRLIAWHPQLSSFKKGEFFDVDRELERLLLQTPSTYK